MVYDVERLLTLDIGRQGENLARTIEIDVRSMLVQWPNAVIFLLVKRKEDVLPYVAATEVANGILSWPITSMETAFAGDGKIEVRAVAGDVVVKSATATIHVRTSLTSCDNGAPNASQGWVDQIVKAGAQAVAGAAKAEEAANKATEAADEAVEAAEEAKEQADRFQQGEQGGVAASAEKLETPRKVSLGGDVNGNVMFDGSEDVTIEASVSVIPNDEIKEMLQ